MMMKTSITNYGKAYFDKDPFAKNLGVSLLESAEGGAKVKMDINQNHFNGLGTVHGGVIFALADLAFAVACNTRNILSIGLQTNICYLRSVNDGPLYAIAKETFCQSKIAHYEVEVMNKNNETIARFQGLAYRKINHRKE